MLDESLIQEDKIVGIFRGFSEGGLEFHADLILPYRPDYHTQPMHGQFLLVQLTDPNEAVLGRITALRSEGRLVDPEGEDYLLRQVVERRPIPEDMRDQYLKFRVDIRVLGVLRREEAGAVTFVPSHRRLPHVGSPVALPSASILRYIAGHSDNEDAGAALGFLAMGEFVWGLQDNRPHRDLQPQSWMRLLQPAVLVRFPVHNLVARRTFVFAQSGFGKSNLVKLLFSELYRSTPQIGKRGGRLEPVGTLIFDRDGEYFWPDDKGRPGLCDVPHLKDHLVVFTERSAPSDYYASFIAGGIRLDIRRLPAAMVVSTALSPERQDQQNVRKLKGLPSDRWKQLVDLVHASGMEAPLKEIRNLLGFNNDEEGALSDVEAKAARSNLFYIVRMLHDPNSRLLDKVEKALKEGKLCVIDLSRLSGEAARVLAGLLLQHLFERNQEEFIKREAATIPIIAVLEEAQSVLGHGESTAYAPFVTWVKEGRKYDLGAVMITQQPGSIPHELLSQGDVWFVFHLLSEGDLKAVQRANAHFSNDLLSALLNEPIPGHCIFWSSAGGKPYPLPIRVLSFEARYQLMDPHYNQPSVSTYARQLSTLSMVPDHSAQPDQEEGEPAPAQEDYLTALQWSAFARLRHDSDFIGKLQRNEILPWGYVKQKLKEYIQELEPEVQDADKMAYRWVRPALECLFGLEDEGAWCTERVNGTTVIRISEHHLRAFLDELG